MTTLDPFQIMLTGSLEDVVLMLENGINVNHTRWSGFSLLHRAAQTGNTDICQILLDHGADVNLKSSRGWYTPLHCALSNGYIETAEYLISRGAKPWVLSKYKENPFDYGTKRGFRELCTDLKSKLLKLEMVQTLQRADNVMKQRAATKT